MRSKLVVVSAALLVSLVAPKLYADVKIAFVDLQRALNETEDGRRAKNQLKKLFDKRQAALDQQQEGLKREKEQLERDSKVLSQGALQKRAEEYQKKFIDLQQNYVEYQRELAEKEAELTKSIFERMEAILRRMGTSEGYSIILDRNEGGVVWGRTDLDLTDRLIQEYNAQGRGGAAGNKAPAKATKRATKRRPDIPPHRE
jgi:outer membrane protein